jgi:hypothetical protein
MGFGKLVFVVDYIGNEETEQAPTLQKGASNRINLSPVPAQLSLSASTSFFNPPTLSVPDICNAF